MSQVPRAPLVWQKSPVFSPTQTGPLDFVVSENLPPQPLTALVGLPPRPSPAARTQTVLRGAGWLLASGAFAVPGGCWHIRVRRQEYEGAETWGALLEGLIEHSEVEGERAIYLDLEKAPRISGLEATEALGALLAHCEAKGWPVAVVIAGDLIQKARVLRLLGHHAPLTARCVMSRAAALRWLKLAPRLAAL
ncbi:hypothetical protein PPSIR1_19714 [Plesiocystis pacifica SIR-1]|uniref:STAS/SEC14 domain-containing protein n=1 Tax=Plesiocystis pacifica SIR-1 TaxID=391625 RepID=A6GAP2_9BACT|nr:hypothetical protein PPSIR1_19714 [Plesiocystis pacifica SIR-1]